MGSVPPIRLRGDIEVNVQHHRSDITDAQTADDRERHQRGLARPRRNVKHMPPRPYLSSSKHRWDKEARPLANPMVPDRMSRAEARPEICSHHRSPEIDSTIPQAKSGRAPEECDPEPEYQNARGEQSG